MKRSCVLTYFVSFLLLTVLFSKSVNLTGDDFRKKYEIIKDLPTKMDLFVFMRSLERVINYYFNHKDEVNKDLKLGLFFVNVNLKSIMKNKKLPLFVQLYVFGLWKQNGKIINIFEDAFNKITKGNRINKMINSLYVDEFLWNEKLKNFNLDLLNKTIFLNDGDLKGLYSEWNDYIDKIKNVNQGIPTPAMSDLCHASLSQNPINHSKLLQACELSNPCYEIILNGSNFGYALTHRLLLLLAAHYGRGCTIFSTKHDDTLSQKMCANVYNEAEYIARNDFQAADLMMEQVALCSLAGHGQFLRRSWLLSLLQYQTSLGCFAVMNFNNTSNLSVQNNKDNRCEKHMDGVASAMLASTVKFVVEMYWK